MKGEWVKVNPDMDSRFKKKESCIRDWYNKKYTIYRL